MSQDEIAHWMLENGLGKYNLQLRHIAAKGWYIATGNRRATRLPCEKTMSKDHLRLVSVTEPNPVWNHAPIVLSEHEWEELLVKFKDRGCAACGLKFDHYDRGHLDPTKPGDKGNIVPLCVSCNNEYQHWPMKFDPKNLVAKVILPKIHAANR